MDVYCDIVESVPECAEAAIQNLIPGKVMKNFERAKNKVNTIFGGKN